MIRVEQLSFAYDGNEVLHHIDVHLPVGSITGLIGPNGAGKSTLMRCIAGLEMPSAGRVLLEGMPIADDPRAAFAKLGYLPDLFGLPPGLSVVQCLSYAAASRGLSEAQLPAAVGETAQLLGLGSKLEHRVGGLSRGQKQRVGIGQAIIHRPRFLLLDEPASGLDPEARHDLSQLLLHLQSNGMTLLVSSHILSELDEYCSHMLVIRNGRIQAHQPLHGGQEAEQTLLLRTAGAASWLEAVCALPPVRHGEVHRDGLLLHLEAGEAARITLLREAVRLGVPFSEAVVLKNTLLQNYQDSIHAQASGAGHANR